jgi:hypothetical protein
LHADTKSPRVLTTRCAQFAAATRTGSRIARLRNGRGHRK